MFTAALLDVPVLLPRLVRGRVRYGTLLGMSTPSPIVIQHTCLSAHGPTGKATHVRPGWVSVNGRNDALRSEVPLGLLPALS